MSEQSSQEPTMEEILASIRRIISEDEAPAAEAAPASEPEPQKAAAAPPPPPSLEPELVPEPPSAAYEAPALEEEDEPLELTQKVETLGDLDVLPPSTPPVPEPAAAPRPMAVAEPTSEMAPSAGLVSEQAASIAASAFSQLSAVIGMPRSDRTLEDVVREMLQPLLQRWLDENLPRIVQEAVEAEVARISRGRVG